MWLALGSVSPLTTAACARVQADFHEQRIGEPAGLVGDDAPVQPAAFERGQHFVAAFEQAGVLGELPAIDVEQPLAHALVRVGGSSPKDSRTSALAP